MVKEIIKTKEVKENNSIEETLLLSTKKRDRVYNIKKGEDIGTFKVEGNYITKGDTRISFNYHSLVLVKAISTFLKEGKTSIERSKLLERALKLDLYKKPSKSSPSYILSWWLKSIKELGYIS